MSVSGVLQDLSQSALHRLHCAFIYSTFMSVLASSALLNHMAVNACTNFPFVSAKIPRFVEIMFSTPKRHVVTLSQ